MSIQAHRWVSALVIVIGVSGCDNVEWGSASLELVYPPSKSPDTLAVAVATPEEPELGLPEGPVLYLGLRTQDRVRVVPMAELRGDSLLPFAPVGEDGLTAYRSAHLQPESRFFLFAAGIRVGTLTLDGITTDASYCGERPAGEGTAELVPSAASVQRFLALSDEAGGAHARSAYAPTEHDFDQRSASVSLSAQVIPEVGARWPEGDWLNYRVDMNALALGPSAPSAFSATFLFRDQVRVGPADSAGYAIFVVGERPGGTYQRVHTWYRSYAAEGKGIPVLYDYLDWDGDGTSEVLLEVLGEETRWVAALDRQEGGWARVYEDPCGRPGEAGGG